MGGIRGLGGQTQGRRDRGVTDGKAEVYVTPRSSKTLQYIVTLPLSVTLWVPTEKEGVKGRRVRRKEEVERRTNERDRGSERNSVESLTDQRTLKVR